MKSKESNWIKAYIIDVMPCISIAIYLLAFIYNNAFYSVFNINLTPYVSFGELLFSIIEPLIIFSFLTFLFLFALNYYFPKWLLITQSRMEMHSREDSDGKLKLRPLRIRYIKAFEDKLLSVFKSKNPLNKLLPIVFLLLFSGILFDKTYVLNSGDVDYGLYKATIGLITPYLVAFFLLHFIIVTTPRIYSQYIKSVNIKDIVAIVISYYIYAIVIFYSCGIESGNYYLNNDKMTFSIKSSDGVEYTDSLYRYIGQTNDKLFLREKKTNRNVILNSKSTTYANVSSNESSSSIIVTFISNLDKSSKNRE